ncbi:hypothetical protein EV363DRAFT_1328337 [Boletus edulis]|nr:hypothetical protein EV363DRAFT_1328337 [Boletus edulis]
MIEPEYATSYAPNNAPLIYPLEKKGFESNFFDWVKENTEVQVTPSSIAAVGKV